MTVIAPQRRRLRRRLKKTRHTPCTQDRPKPPDQSDGPTKAKQQVYLNTKEAAEFLRLSPVTMARWRTEGKGPPFRKFGRRVVYGRRDLLRWGRTVKFLSTSEVQ